MTRTGADPRIRPATPADVPALLALEERAFASDRLDRRAFRHAAGSPSMALLVAEEWDRPAGYAALQFRRGSRAAWLTSLAAAERGRGLGRALLAACEAEAARRGCERVRLEVRADNEGAIRLYERAGYRRTGRSDGYYEDGGAALRFERALRP